MSLTRFLPTPSDRMGILWTLLNIDESVIIEYGPAGTTHYSMGLFGELGIDQENRLFTTHLREDDVVMGDTSRLESTILEVDHTFNPKVIFVVASSSSAVIGTDIRGVCTMMQEKVKAKLISFEEGGFRGDYAVGLKLTYSLLVESICKNANMTEGNTTKQTGNTKRYNILGASAGAYRCASDVNEIVRLMREVFDMTVHTSLCYDTSVTKLMSMDEVDINIVLRSEALDAARELEKTFGTPYIYVVPYGYEKTIDFLQTLAKILQVAPNEKVLARLQKKSKQTSMYKMYARMFKQHKMQAFLYGEYECVKGLNNFLQGLGFTVPYTISSHNTHIIEEKDSAITYLQHEKDRIDVLKSLDHTLVLADDTSSTLVDKTNTYMRISMPLIFGSQVAQHVPIIGEHGTDLLIETIDAYLNTLK